MADHPLIVIEAIERLESEMPEPNKNILKNTPRDKLEILHLTLGVWLRNNFGLGTGENEKLLYSCAENSDMPPVFILTSKTKIIIFLSSEGSGSI